LSRITRCGWGTAPPHGPSCRPRTRRSGCWPSDTRSTSAGLSPSTCWPSCGPRTRHSDRHERPGPRPGRVAGPAAPHPPSRPGAARDAPGPGSNGVPFGRSRRGPAAVTTIHFELRSPTLKQIRHWAASFWAVMTPAQPRPPTPWSEVRPQAAECRALPYGDEDGTTGWGHPLGEVLARSDVPRSACLVCW
jgi:hypothetical protein